MRRTWLASLAIVLVTTALSGQQGLPANVPRAAAVFPAGGQRGTTVEVTISGRFLATATSILVSGDGVTTRLVGADRPLTQREITVAREEMQAVQSAAAADPAAMRKLAALRARIADSVRRNQTPAFAERVVVSISIAPDAAAGARVLRVLTPQGLSNPLVFDVDQLRESTEPGDEAAPMPIELPAIVNGRIVPFASARGRAGQRGGAQMLTGDVDRYRFQARRGESIVAAVRARALQPFIADAVPGWFQAAVTIRDEAGRSLVFADDTATSPDPAAQVVIPDDGWYSLEIGDALSRGRDDFVYRVAVGAFPYVTSVFPLGVRAGTRAQVRLDGWNLPAAHVTYDATTLAPGVHAWMPAMPFNSVPVAVGDLPETVEREPNDATPVAMPIGIATIVNGRIERAGDVDVFRVQARSGQRLVFEITARTLASALDSMLEVFDADGALLAVNDDCAHPLWGTATHFADSSVIVAAPAAGALFVRVSDTTDRGGPEYGYRLRVSEPRPDVDVRMAPSAIIGPGPMPVTIAVHRKDGFDGDVTVVPVGGARVTLAGGRVPSGATQVRATLTLPAPSNLGPQRVRFEARATIGGRVIARPVTPADVRIQAFASEHFVAAPELITVPGGRGRGRAPARIISVTPLVIPIGGSATVRIALPPAARLLERIAFDLVESPPGLTIGNVTVGAQVADIELRAQPGVAGTRGNLLIGASGERAAAAGAAGEAAVRRRESLGLLPAIPFELK